MGLINLVLPMAMASGRRDDLERGPSSSQARREAERRDADAALDPADAFADDDDDDGDGSTARGAGPVEQTWTVDSTAVTVAAPGPFRRAITRIRQFLFQSDPIDSDMVPHYRYVRILCGHGVLFSALRQIPGLTVPHHRYLPILSGMVVPFSTLLEIPGLTEHWYA